LTKTDISRNHFLNDPQGKTFADIVNDQDMPFEAVLTFFNDDDRQRRMEESELHHDRSPLAGVVRELESLPELDRFMSDPNSRSNMRFRQAIGVLVRVIMESRGWQKTGRKGSLGVRATDDSGSPAHNSGGLALWFVRAERYQLPNGMPYQTVKSRSQAMIAAT
jgi:hypothetical protein